MPLNKLLLLGLAWIIAAGCLPAFAGEKVDQEKEISVFGWLVENNPATHTFAIRHGKKLLQFTTIPSRTSIIVGDWETFQRSLSSARIGDAVRVTVSMTKARPYVESAKFTHRPATATPIKGRPGFVMAPYSHSVFDVGKCAHGEMLEDVWPGKIFLVP